MVTQFGMSDVGAGSIQGCRRVAIAFVNMFTSFGVSLSSCFLVCLFVCLRVLGVCFASSCFLVSLKKHEGLPGMGTACWFLSFSCLLLYLLVPSTCGKSLLHSFEFAAVAFCWLGGWLVVWFVVFCLFDCLIVRLVASMLHTVSSCCNWFLSKQY